MEKTTRVLFLIIAGLALQSAYAIDGANSTEHMISKGPVERLPDMDRFYSDPCYMSNCGREPVAQSAPGRIDSLGVSPRSPDSTFLSISPSYSSGVSCTSLLGVVSDNAFMTVLQDTFTVGSSGEVLVQLSAEPRIQRENGSSIAGVGAVGARLTLEGPAGSGSSTQTLFSRWILHTPIDDTLITTVSNPSGVNQPAIATASVSRYLSGLTPGDYTIKANFKWSVVFTDLPLETSTIAFATGQRGALVCQPNLIVETW
ncbi:MAG: hypothetical protein HND55_10010 [Pseudomonadota bacterium]|nr:MAG: hypothetical protein HND55_10010 [Pseudomonadota bacterium]